MVVEKTSMKKRQMTEFEECSEHGRKGFKNTRSSNDFVLHKSGKVAAQTSRKGTKPTANFAPVKDFVILVRPKGEGEHAVANFYETFKLASSKFDPIQSKIDSSSMNDAHLGWGHCHHYKQSREPREAGAGCTLVIMPIVTTFRELFSSPNLISQFTS